MDRLASEIYTAFNLACAPFHDERLFLKEGLSVLSISDASKGAEELINCEITAAELTSRGWVSPMVRMG